MESQDKNILVSGVDAALKFSNSLDLFPVTSKERERERERVKQPLLLGSRSCEKKKEVLPPSVI